MTLDNPARLHFAPFQNWEHAHNAWLTIRGKRSQSIGHNTSLVGLGNDDVGVKLYNTVIVIFHRDNTVTLDSGRYRTVTTKARMNAVLPPTLRVDQVKRQWSVREIRTGDTVPFFDGMRIKLPYEDNPKRKAVPFERTELYTWFERDRAHVELRDIKTGETIIEWWDEAVQEAVEDGFLNPRDWKGSAYEYAKHLGIIR